MFRCCYIAGLSIALLACDSSRTGTGEVKAEDLVGTWQSEERDIGWTSSQRVAVISRSKDGTYKIKSYFVDHDLKAIYLRDEWNGSWTIKDGKYVEVDPEAHFTGPEEPCKREGTNLVFSYIGGEGLHSHTIKVVDSPSPGGQLSFATTYSDVKSEEGWEELWRKDGKKADDKKSEQAAPSKGDKPSN